MTIDVGKLIDLENLKHYHDMLDEEYLSPIEEKVTNYATDEEIDDYIFDISDKVEIIDVVFAERSDSSLSYIHIYFNKGVEATGNISANQIKLSLDGTDFSNYNIGWDYTVSANISDGHMLFVSGNRNAIYNNDNVWIKIPANYLRLKSDSTVIDYDIVAKIKEPPVSGEMKLKKVNFNAYDYSNTYVHFYDRYTYPSSGSSTQYSNLVEYSYDGGETFSNDPNRVLEANHSGLSTCEYLKVQGNNKVTYYMKIPENIGFISKDTGEVMTNQELIIRIPAYY